MINFEGYYFVDAEQIEYINTRNRLGEAQYGLFLNLKSGQELGVWYRTEASRRQASEKMARMIENERRGYGCYAERITNRLYEIEKKLETLNKRQMRIWRQLKALLNISADEET